MKAAAFLFLAVTACAHSQARMPSSVVTDWCAAVASEELGEARAIEIELSAAHAKRRFFGTGEKYSLVDQALAKALSQQKVDSEVSLSAYARELADSCWLSPQSAAPTQQPEVHTEGDVAWMKPSLQPPNLPAQIRAVVIDLRLNPSSGAVEETLRTLLTESLPLPSRMARGHQGMTDEFFAPVNVFSNQVQASTMTPVEGRAKIPRALYVLAGQRLSPKVATLVGALRLQRRAWLVGAPVSTRVAEATLMPVGDHVLAFRVYDFMSEGTRWPDEFAPDLPEAEMRSRFARGDFELTPPEVLSPSPQRPTIAVMNPHKDIQPPAHGLGDARAAILITHGALRLFYPDFEDVGDRIDERLREVLSKIDKLPAPPSIGESRNLVRRFGEAIRDGHSFVFAQPSDPEIKGYAPIVLDTIGGRLFVRRSSLPEFAPGDEIVSFGGLRVRDFYRTQLPMTSASTLGYRYDIANREVVKLKSPKRFNVRGKKPIIVEPGPMQKLVELKAGTPELRASGWLTDLDAKNVYYLNLSRDLMPTIEDFRKHLEVAVAANAKKIILDMRGYPGIDTNEVASRLICTKFSTPILRTVIYASPEKREWAERNTELQPAEGLKFCGPLDLIVGPHTVSAAEHFSTILVDAKRVRVVAESTSAGSNGNIPGLQLPGALAFTFSGMRVLHTDRSPFMGIGIVPDVLVPLTARDLTLGRDAVLQRAAGSD